MLDMLLTKMVYNFKRKRGGIEDLKIQTPFLNAEIIN